MRSCGKKILFHKPGCANCTYIILACANPEIFIIVPIVVSSGHQVSFFLLMVIRYVLPLFADELLFGYAVSKPKNRQGSTTLFSNQE